MAAGSQCVQSIKKPIEQPQAHKNIVQTLGQHQSPKDDKFTHYCYWKDV